MPARIYEIAKDLNLESKVVLAKARELGIGTAKVPSSQLDKITAEYLKEQLLPLTGPHPLLPGDISLDSAGLALLIAQLAYLEPAMSPMVEKPTEERLYAALENKSVMRGDDVAYKVGKLSHEFEPDSLWHAWFVSSQLEFFHQMAHHQADRSRQPTVIRLPLKADNPTVIMKPPITVRELADKMGRKPFQVIADLMAMGAFVTVNQAVDLELARKVCAKNNIHFQTE